jgi:hypothetical protein
MADSGDSSLNSAATTDDAHHEGLEPSAAAAPPHKVRLMVSYGGRIQPRPHDSQLAYVNGVTKILSLDRPLCFADFAVPPRRARPQPHRGVLRKVPAAEGGPRRARLPHQR